MGFGSASFQPAAAPCTRTWGFAPGYYIAGLQPAWLAGRYIHGYVVVPLVLALRQKCGTCLWPSLLLCVPYPGLRPRLRSRRALGAWLCGMCLPYGAWASACDRAFGASATRSWSGCMAGRGVCCVCTSVTRSPSRMHYTGKEGVSTHAAVWRSNSHHELR